MPFALRTILLCGALQLPAQASPPVLQADFRPRPPDMFLDTATGRPSGPLVTILEEAARELGHEVNWREAPFPRSLEDLRTGRTDIVPRVIDSAERRTFIVFLGPAGFQQNDILFLVKKGDEQSIRQYRDLYGINIGKKRGTLYFDAFDHDKSLRKIEALDDDNLVSMFRSGRFQTMIVLDRPALESVLKARSVQDYAFADYRVRQKTGIYYGMSKLSGKLALSGALSSALQRMAANGRVAAHYQRFGLVAPY